ncbi:MAG TPA: protease modulator HflC [Steroidobacteraceae bacterium]|jgi:membrane protease subunit HflC
MYQRIIAAVALLLVAVLLWRSVFAVNEGEAALITRFGVVQPGDYAPGAHLKSPFDEVHKFDRRLSTRAYQGEAFLSQDQKAVTIDFYLKWRLVDPARYFQATGGDEDTAAARLGDMVRERIKSAVAAEPLAAAITGTKLTDDTLHIGDLRAPSTRLGVELVDARLQRIDLPDDLANSVYARMQQNLTTQAQQLRTQGSSEADKIRADAEHTRAQILADATRDAQRVRGEADAAAAADYARAYGANAEFAAFYRSLQAYKNSLGRDGDILVIAPEGEFFKYLHSASGR